MRSRSYLIIFSASFLSFIYFLGIISFLLNINSPFIHIIEFSYIGFISLLLFIVILFAIRLKPKLYFLFLPFILIAFPSAINNLFPSFFLGPLDELNAATFSFFTHIDIYLMFGLLSFKNNNRHNTRFLISRRNNNFLIMCFLIVLFIYTSIIILISKTSIDLALFAVGNYQIRYLIYFLLISLKFDIDLKKIKYIIYGILFSILFLFVESLVFTYLIGSSRLISGTLGNNVYANIVAAIAFLLLILFFYHKKMLKSMRIKKSLILSSLFLCVFIIYFTGTRMAFVSLIIGTAIFLFSSSLFGRLNMKYFLGIFLTLSIVTAIFVNKNERFKSLFRIVLSNDFTELVLSANPDVNYDEYTSSLFTRFLLIKTSISMIKDNPIFGIGPGRWNLKKYEHGFNQRVLMDPHNDYLPRH